MSFKSALQGWGLCIAVISTVLFALPPRAAAEPQAVQITHDGLRLNGLLSAAPDEMKGGRVVLMLHGTLAHNQMEIMKGLQAALGERELATLAITLSLGQDNRTGMFDCKAEHMHQHEDAMREVGLWVDWLENAGVKEIILLGHSRGGNQIAWFAAEQMRASVSKVVLMAPATDEGDGAASYEKRYGKPLAPLLKQAQAAGERFLEAVDFIYCPKAKVRGRSFVSYYKAEPRRDSPALIGKIKRPVLVLIAANDEVVTSLPQRMTALGALKNLKAVTISEAGHMFLDFALEDAADAIAEFVQ